MATHAPYHHEDKHSLLDSFTLSRGRLTTGLILIALGVVFLLGQSGQLDYGSPWWVLFIAIPGIVIVGGSVKDYFDAGKLTAPVFWEFLIGAAALVLSAIFVWDPTWSFTRSWSDTFPFLRNMSTLWPWLIVAVGAFALYRAYTLRSMRMTVVGLVLCIVGAVFILNISWDAVWPLIIVAAGVYMLFSLGRKQSE